MVLQSSSAARLSPCVNHCHSMSPMSSTAGSSDDGAVGICGKNTIGGNTIGGNTIVQMLLIAFWACVAIFSHVELSRDSDSREAEMMSLICWISLSVSLSGAAGSLLR